MPVDPSERCRRQAVDYYGGANNKASLRAARYMLCYPLTSRESLNNMQQGIEGMDGKEGGYLMAETTAREATGDGWNIPSKYLPAIDEYKDLPDPQPLRRYLGASVILLATARLGRADHLALRHLTGGGRIIVARFRRVLGAVLHQHGGRALHSGDRRDRRHGF